MSKMNESPLFDALLKKGPSPGVTDTSREAAKRIEPNHGTLAHTVYEVITHRGEYGATTSEISNIRSINYRGIQPRTSELKQMKLIYDSGQRRKNEYGNNEIVWVSHHHEPQEANNDEEKH
jgi:hypothetical protein